MLLFAKVAVSYVSVFIFTQKDKNVYRSTKYDFIFQEIDVKYRD
jgi:hypothetical protein